MKVFSAAKVLSSLPDPLVADTMYCVRVGTGFDLYITDTEGLIAYKVNMPAPAWTQLTQAQYDALSPPDAGTLYVIVG